MFSSSKEIITDRRTNIAPDLLSELQMLKQSYRQEWLSFTAQVVADERDYVLEGGVTSAAAQELLAAGKFSELEYLLDNAYTTTICSLFVICTLMHRLRRCPLLAAARSSSPVLTGALFRFW